MILVIIAGSCPQVQDLHGRLNGEWDLFQRKLIDCDQTLQEQKEKFKNSLLLSSQDFREKTKTSLKDFAETGHTLVVMASPGAQTWLVSSEPVCSVFSQVPSTARWAVIQP